MLLRAPNFKVDDRYETVTEFCGLLDAIWKCGPGEPWTLDLRNCEYLGPDAAVLTYSTFLVGASLGQRPKVLQPTSPPKLDAFCLFSGLRHYLEKGKRPSPNDPQSETLPLNQFFEVIGNQSAPLVGLVRRHMDTLSEDNETYLSTAFQETVQNIADHADSPIGGISCARFFSKSSEARLAFVDRGVGFAGSLRKRLGPLSSMDALKKVLNEQMSARSRENNQGLGLFYLSQFVRNLGGELVIVTGNAVAHFFSPSSTWAYNAVDWNFPGTGVFLCLRLDTRPD